MLDLAVVYVGQREQFGRLVGSFQAVKHMLADTLLVTETSKAAGWYAAYAIAEDLHDRSEAVSIAKSTAAESERVANRNALQAYGGVGFTWEYDLHLYMKRGKALEQTYGSPTEHRRVLADRIFA